MLAALRRGAVAFRRAIAPVPLNERIIDDLGLLWCDVAYVGPEAIKRDGYPRPESNGQADIAAA